MKPTCKLVSICASFLFLSFVSAQDNRPKFVFILSDDQAWDDYGFMKQDD